MMQKNKILLLYYTSMVSVPTGEGKDHKPAQMVDYDELDKIVDRARKDLARSSEPGTLYLREVETFNGVEQFSNELPDAVLILGVGTGADAVREAYEALEVPVSQRDFDDVDLQEGPPSHDEDRFDGDMNKLRERATELTIQFAPSIGYKALLGRVLQREKEIAQQGGESNG